MVDVPDLLEDLDGEGADLDALVAPLDDGAWATPTPAPGWTIAHQIAHLAWTDEAALAAVTAPGRFATEYLSPAAELMASGRSLVDEGASDGAAEPPPELLARWRRARHNLSQAFARAAAAGSGKIVWFGPPMSLPSMVTARIMETWAHGQDVADALGVNRIATARLRHVAHLGVRTRDFAFRARGLTPPAEEFHVELTAPDGQTWTWGQSEGAQRVSGPAEDFCLVVTQRRHVDDVALVADGDDARAWLGIAQAFAGPPGAGREPKATA